MLARTSQRAVRPFLPWLQLPAASFATGVTKVVEMRDDADVTTTLKQAADAGQLAIVDFTAKWCGPCRMIGPIYDTLSVKYPEALFVKVDIDAPALADTVQQHTVTGVPTFVYYKGGRRVEAFSGARPDMLEDLIKKHIK